MKTLQYTLRTSQQKLINSRAAIVCVTFLILSWTYDQIYLEFVWEKAYPINWCILPFQFTSCHNLIMFYLGIIYLNADVPFLQHQNMYQVIRTGRGRWAIGQMGGIALRSFGAVITTAIAAVLPFAGYIEFSAEWGKVIRTLASQRGTDNFGFETAERIDFRFFYQILEKYTPVQLMTITVLLLTLICIFIGLFMFLLSLFAGKITAAAGALSFVIALFIVENTNGPWKPVVSHFIPTYWGEVALIESPVSGRYRLPSLEYMFTFLIVTITVMSAIIYQKVKRMEFNWENEDA